MNEDGVVMRVIGSDDDGSVIVGRAKGNESVNEIAGVSVGDGRIHRSAICVCVGTMSDCDCDGVFSWLQRGRWMCVGMSGGIHECEVRTQKNGGCE